jgi:hypothetical protein
MSLFIIFQYYAGLFLVSRKLDLPPIAVSETTPRSSVSMVYEHRLRELNESCDCSNSTCDIHNYKVESLLRQHHWLTWVTLLLPSHSLMYCAVPKIATKALLTVMLYVHLRDISEHLNNNWTNVDVAIAQTEQRLNISPFINELRKVL